MNTEEIFQQVIDENCKDPLHRFAELVRQDEREQWDTSDMAYRPGGLTVDVTDLIQRAIDMERKECAEMYRKIMDDAILREREACAELCDDASLYFIDQGMNAVDGADYCANEIRGRTEPKSDFKTQMDDNWAGLI